MNQNKRKSHFEDNQSGYHRSAVNILAGWTSGEKEIQFMLNDLIYFVPDVTVYKEGVLDSIYEVVYANVFTGKKLGLIQYWCYVNFIELTVFEVSADYILSQTRKPEYIQTMECYEIVMNH